ncbi:hypothetical protein BD779DRAFT_1465366 [Infundibulicybe gibba]|nr:hypothetical protein BD779DRAFT_1465366 [Infundibulicybe gibba]
MQFSIVFVLASLVLMGLATHMPSAQPHKLRRILQQFQRKRYLISAITAFGTGGSLLRHCINDIEVNTNNILYLFDLMNYKATPRPSESDGQAIFAMLQTDLQSKLLFALDGIADKSAAFEALADGGTGPADLILEDLERLQQFTDSFNDLAAQFTTLAGALNTGFTNAIAAYINE